MNGEKPGPAGRQLLEAGGLVNDSSGASDPSSTRGDQAGLLDGEMAERIRAFDWANTPLGPVETWSPALRMMVRFLQANRSPLLLGWGPQYVSIYNDAYRPVLGTKHPWALGKPVSDCWKEIWHILQPLIDTPFRGGPATWNDDILLEINRHGFVEETHFTIAYSPVPDEAVPSGIGGVLATVHEITGKAVGDRRLKVLRDLGARSTEARTAEEACVIAAETLSAHDRDIPFALLYLIDTDRETARLAGTTGVAMGEQASPASLSLKEDGVSHSLWPLAEAARSEAMHTVTPLSSILGDHVPRGPWQDPPHTAVVVPIPSNKAHHLAGFLVAGISARLELDASYRDFLDLVSSQIATSIASAQAVPRPAGGAGESEARFRALVEASSDAVYRMSPDWTEMCHLVGKDFIADTKEPTRTWLQKYIHPDDHEQVMAVIAEAIRSKSVFELEHRVLRRDGSLGWTFSRAVPILDANGAIIEWFGVARDVTESHEIRENLRRQAELLDLAHDTIFIRDEEDRITYWNKGAELRYGWSEREVLGKEPHTLLRTGFSEPLEKIRDTLKRTGHWSGELVHTCRDGRIITVDSRWAIQHDAEGDGFRVLEISNDISDRKRAEAERQKFVSLADHSVEFIGMCDLEFNPFYVNEAGRRIVGLDSMEEACSVQVQDYFFPEDRDQIMNEFFPKVLREGRGELEVRFRHFKTDAAIWMIFNVFQVRGEDGKLIGYATVSRDITERKRAEDALRQADRHKDEFLATLAHELRNPLAPIRTGLDLLKRAGDNPALREKVRCTMERQTEQLVTLVNDLLDVSRISRGILELRRSRVALGDIIRSAVESAQPFIDKERHLLSVHLPDEPIHLDGDPHRLAQVVSNLLNNAARYTPSGGRIWLTAQRLGGELLLAVRDNGIGIQPEMREHIFDMFAQADHNQERAKAGLGIGLTLVKSLVEMHGGTVDVHSEGPGRGSEFRVRLPILAEEEAAERRPAEEPSAVTTPARRVLVVDDNEAAADTLAEILAMSGHDVRTASDGEQAVQVANDFRPEVILMDLGMPKMNGYEAARAIRGQPWGKDILLVALTGWGQADVRQRTKEAGFDRHLVKPPDAEEILRLFSTPGAR